jgi:hypothetical protein
VASSRSDRMPTPVNEFRLPSSCSTPWTRCPCCTPAFGPPMPDGIESSGDPLTEVRSDIYLIGHLQGTYLEELQAQIEGNGPKTVLDLNEVTLVDVEAVRFLGGCEAAGIAVLHGPPYIDTTGVRRGYATRAYLSASFYSSLGCPGHLRLPSDLGAGPQHMPIGSA